MMRQLVSFALIGAGGFVVDVGVLLLLMSALGANPYAARVVSFLCAATFTWRLNRALTFPQAPKAGAAGQWLLFLAANAGGGVVNLAAYSALIATSIAPAVAAVACGSIAGLGWNFFASRQIVFRRGQCDENKPAALTAPAVHLPTRIKSGE